MHRSAHFPRTLGVALVLAASASLALGVTISAHGYDARVTGHVYVNDNTAGVNTIAGFDRHADGTLTPIAGSPFAAGGAGTGGVIGSQGALQFAHDGHFVLAVDAGSNQIAVLRVKKNGALTPVAGSPVSSNGILPVSIAVHGDLVYVANDGNGASGSNYTGYTLSHSGRLSPLSGSTFALPGAAGPGDVLFNGPGTRLIGTRVNTSQIDSFIVNEHGDLTAAPGSPYNAQGAGPFGSAFRPTNADQLYVSNAHDGAGNGTVSAYHDNWNGTLTSIGGSPYADNQTAPCWVTITPNGRYLFTVNTGSSSISSYAIAENGTLSLIGSTTLKDATGLRPFDMTVTPNGQYAYVVDPGHVTVSAFAVSEHGSLSELVSSPIALPTGATPFGIIAD
ncbi:MAG: lactonase family protein [Ktedonobacterales bacterium]